MERVEIEKGFEFLAKLSAEVYGKTAKVNRRLAELDASLDEIEIKKNEVGAAHKLSLDTLDTLEGISEFEQTSTRLVGLLKERDELTVEKGSLHEANHHYSIILGGIKRLDNSSEVVFNLLEDEKK